MPLVDSRTTGLGFKPGVRAVRSQRDLKATYEQRKVHQRWKAAYRESPLQDRLNAAMLDRLLSSTGLERGARILDAGCGDGTHTIAIARRGFDCTGIDISQTILKDASARILEAGVGARARVACSSLEALTFPDRSFDLVHCRGVLMHIPRWEDALRQLIRVLKPDGYLVLFESNTQAVELSLVRALRWIRKPISRTQDVPGGLEWWAEIDRQPFVVRAARIAFVQRRLVEWGLAPLQRWASEFWDVHRFPAGLVRNTVIRFNRAWFDWQLPARLSMGNVLIAQRHPLGRQ